jgi:hypothetical protein
MPFWRRHQHFLVVIRTPLSRQNRVALTSFAFEVCLIYFAVGMKESQQEMSGRPLWKDAIDISKGCIIQVS